MESQLPPWPLDYKAIFGDGRYLRALQRRDQVERHRRDGRTWAERLGDGRQLRAHMARTPAATEGLRGLGEGDELPANAAAEELTGLRTGMGAHLTTHGANAAVVEACQQMLRNRVGPSAARDDQAPTTQAQ